MLRAASAGLPPSPCRVIFIDDFSPVLVELSTRRNGVPLPSLMMLALTPILALLMASRMPSSVLLLPSMVTPVSGEESYLKLPARLLPLVPALRPAAAGLLPPIVMSVLLAEVRRTLVAEV